jgi:peptide/nickel transport system permease protein
MAEKTDRKSRMTREEERLYTASQWSLMWRKFKKNKVAITGGIVIGLFYLTMVVLGGFIAPYGLRTRFIQHNYAQPQRIHLFDGWRIRPFVYGLERWIDPVNLRRMYRVNEDVKYPVHFFVRGEEYKFWGLFETDRHLFGVEEEGTIFLLGTDRQGRDMFSRVVLGGRISLTIGLISVFLSLALGSVLGVASGYYGGRVDDLIQRLIELLRSFPPIPLWMALSASLPPHWSPLKVYFGVTLILSVIGWTWLARQLRGKVLSLREQEFVMSAKLCGASDRQIIARHLIPGTLSHIIVVATLAMPGMILAETALSFLGLGLRPPITSWGVLLQEAQNMRTLAHHPWLALPVLFIIVAVLSYNFLGDGLRDAADPYSQ